MKQITMQEFFATVGRLDVHPHLIGNYPYRSDWKLRNGALVGRSIDRIERGLIATSYYVPERS